MTPLRATLAALATALLTLPAAAGDWSKLMTPDQVAALDPETVAIIDIRGPEAYAKGHLEGAFNVPYGAWRGPKENPGALISDAKLTEILQNAGVEPDSRVLVVNGGENPTAFGATARVYWTLKSAGLTELSILNGGYKAWAASGRALTTVAPAVMMSEASYRIAETWAISRDEVRAVVDGQSDALLIDARPDDFFRGKAKHPAASWAGTLEGAVNIVHESFFGADGTMRDDPEAVLAAVEASGYTPGTTVVSFCNTGHWAASNWFALSEIAGIEGVKLYPESMSGWTAFFSQS